MPNTETCSNQESASESNQDNLLQKEFVKPNNNGKKNSSETEKENIKNKASNESTSPSEVSKDLQNEELANSDNLSDCDIHKVKYFHQMKRFDEKNLTEVTDMHENELPELRKRLEEILKQKAELENDCKTLFEENKNLKQELYTINNGYNDLQQNFEVTDTSINILLPKYLDLQVENNSLVDQNNCLNNEKFKLIVELDETRKLLEKEKLARIEKESLIQTLHEEVKYRKEAFKKQVTEKKITNTDELSLINNLLEEKYNKKLIDDIHSIHQKYEINLEKNREEIKNFYEEKLNSLESELAVNKMSSTMALNEVKITQLKLKEMNECLVEMEKEKVSSLQQVCSLRRQLVQTKAIYVAKCQKYKEHFTECKWQLENQREDYINLMKMNDTLNLEISMYRKLPKEETKRS